ncbi:hypothetical protein HK096_003726 [Nowakowskiella sp. JEL0078]|nr:hypothetical protein HK096_003726 [Nowakowskiella sp. JEL0078]
MDNFSNKESEGWVDESLGSKIEIAKFIEVSKDIAIIPIEEDDDFGDFDDFASVELPTVDFQVSVITTESIQTTEEDELFSKTLTILSDDNSETQTILDSITELILHTFPIALTPTNQFVVETLDDLIIEDVPTSTPTGSATDLYSKPNSEDSKIFLPNSVYEDEKWFQLWEALSEEFSTNSEVLVLGSKFRWKKSEIRKLFLDSFDIVELKSTTPEPISNTKNNTTISENIKKTPQNPNALSDVVEIVQKGSGNDAPDSLLQTAKALCEISEDDLRKRTAGQLQDMIKQLLQSSTSLHQQANNWLDAKEQLLMDAEMHNKMIASLVQYAQQLQVQGPKGLKI